MPKAKPDQVIVHRIELQETERATLEAALAGRFVTNAAHAGAALLTGVGTALVPFTGAISALAALWIADKTIDEIKDAITTFKETSDLLYDSGVQANGTYSATVAYLNVNYANSGFDKLPVSPNPSALTTEQRESWVAHVEDCGSQYGPFNAAMLIKVVAKSLQWGMGDGQYIDQRTGTPGEWFTREITLEEWQAAQVSFNARRR